MIVFDATSPVRALLKFRKGYDRWKLCYYGSAMLDAFDKLAQLCEVLVLLWHRPRTSARQQMSAEWVDILAVLARQMQRVVILRQAASFFAMKPTQPPRGWFRWEVERGRRVALGWLSGKPRPG